MTKPGGSGEPRFDRSSELNERLARVVPGGAHTYAKGVDQYPEGMAPVIVRGEGSHVWDVDGNELIEYGSGLRAVALGHAHPKVNRAVAACLAGGMNFARPSALELETAERFLSVIRGADMVKFTKNGSDATSAAVKLARAVTGRDLVAVCADQPFFSVDDWFIGSTPMPAGIPEGTRALTVRFPFDDLDAVAGLFAEHPRGIACLVLEAATTREPSPGYFAGLRALCDAEGALLVLDEMITGFRWHPRGAQEVYGIEPDLCTFGKALGNGFAISALAGRREHMERGGLRSSEERVFLLSTTHGAESVGLAAAWAVLDVYQQEPVVETLYATGTRLAEGVRAVAADAGVGEQVGVLGRPCNLVYTTKDAAGNPSQALRTLFLEQLLLRGILAPSFVVSAATSTDDVDRTVEAVAEACRVYAKALEDGVERHLTGRPVQPVFRPYA